MFRKIRNVGAFTRAAAAKSRLASEQNWVLAAVPLQTAIGYTGQVTNKQVFMSKVLLVNFDRKEYVRPEAFGDEPDIQSVVRSHDGVLLGLAVLLADGNGRGGGDLDSRAAVIGSWAGQRVAIVDADVVDPALSEPGLAEVPLMQQLLRLGRDVSGDVAAAIAEGDSYSIQTELQRSCRIPLPLQRKMTQGARRRLSVEHRAEPLNRLEDFFGLFAVGAAWSTRGRQRRLQEGLSRLAAAFGVPAPEVQAVAVTGFEQQASERFEYVEHPPRTVVVTLLSPVPGEERVLTRKFLLDAEKGCTAAEVYEQLLGVRELDAPAPLGVRSAEVAKLLSMIPNLGV